MKAKLIIIACLFFLMFSCEEKVDYEVNIYLQNQTGSMIRVVLLPTEPYSGMMGYKFSSNGGGYRSTSFQIENETSYLLFSNAGLSEKPSQVAQKAYEEIIITFQDGYNTRIFFSPDSAINYKFNIFSNDTIWIFEKHMNVRPTQFKNNPVESHDYYFVIDSI